MKKLFFFLALTLSFSACKKSGVDAIGGSKNCENWSVQYSSELNSFIANPTKKSCENFKKSLTDFSKKCRSYMSAIDKKDFDAAVADIDCSDFN